MLLVSSNKVVDGSRRLLKHCFLLAYYHISELRFQRTLVSFEKPLSSFACGFAFNVHTGSSSVAVCFSAEIHSPRAESNYESN